MRATKLETHASLAYLGGETPIQAPKLETDETHWRFMGFIEFQVSGKLETQPGNLKPSRETRNSEPEHHHSGFQVSPWFQVSRETRNPMKPIKK